VSELLRKAVAPRDGAAAWFAAVVRVVAGVAFVLFGIGKFADHMKEAADFDNYGVPLPDIAVWVSGTIEVVGGALLVVGLLTRLAAAALAVNLVVAISTAGVMEGGSFHLGVGPTLLVAMLFLLWAGGGVWSLDGKLSEAGRGPGSVRGAAT
jgi:putative oxidoreductase